MPPHRGVHHRDGRGPLLNAVLARGHRTVRIRPDQRRAGLAAVRCDEQLGNRSHHRWAHRLRGK